MAWTFRWWKEKICMQCSKDIQSLTSFLKVHGTQYLQLLGMLLLPEGIGAKARIRLAAQGGTG